MNRYLCIAVLLFSFAAVAVIPSCGDSTSSGTGGTSGGGTGGMSGGGTGGAAAGPSFAATVAPIFMSFSCRFCHAGGGTVLPALMDLNAAGAVTSLVGVDSVECAGMGGRKRVVAGDPDHSYLIDKLKGTNLCDFNGAPSVRMPMGGMPSYLSDDQIATVAAWIRGGAAP